jgi:hypothetical protein
MSHKHTFMQTTVVTGRAPGWPTLTVSHIVAAVAIAPINRFRNYKLPYL